MADRLIYKGGATVVDQSGTGMQLVLPKRGGSVNKFPQWWNVKKSVKYIECAIFNVLLDNGSSCRLIVPHVDPGMTFEIRHDGNGEFTFPMVNKGKIDRVAVVQPDSNDLIIEYQFSKISGGSVLKRTVGSFPPGDPVTFTGFTTYSGNPQVGTDLQIFAATYTGGVNVSSVQVQLQVSNDGSTGWSGVNALTNSPDVQSIGAALEGKYLRVITSVTDDLGTVTQPSETTLGPIGPSAFAVAVTNATFSYDVTVVDDNGTNVYALDGNNQAGITGSAGDTFHFDLSDASLSVHPFKIYTDATKTTEVTVGIERQGTDLLFTPPIAGTFSYQCASHANMGGDITIN